MNKEIPLIIVGLILLYIVLSISRESFDMYKDLPHRKLDLTIEPVLIKGHLPIGSEQQLQAAKSVPIPKASGLLTKYRENPSKYIRESMLLNKPNHNLGFQPSNVRYMDLMYNKPNEIGSLPMFIGKIPDKIIVPKLTQKVTDEEAKLV